jgi:hypothetical protein
VTGEWMSKTGYSTSPSSARWPCLGIVTLAVIAAKNACIALMGYAEFAVMLLGQGAYRNHGWAFAVSEITFRTGDRATDRLT